MRHRKITLIGWGSLAVMVAVLVVIFLTQGGGGNAGDAKPGDNAPRRTDGLAEISLHAGKFTTWYVDQTTLLCAEYLGKHDSLVKTPRPPGAMGG